MALNSHLDQLKLKLVKKKKKNYEIKKIMGILRY